MYGGKGDTMMWAHLCYVLPIALFVIISLALLTWYGVRYQQIIALLSSEQHRALMVPGYSAKRFWIKLVCYGAAVFGIAFALLRPQSMRDTPIVRHEQGRDVVIAVDISRSMLAQDCQPNRLACAKAKIIDLVTQLHSERVGLIVFSGAAFVQSPLTKDMQAFRLFLDALDPQMLSVAGTTALDQALLAGVQMFSQVPRKNKLMILVTDGEDFSKNLDHARSEVEKIGLSVAIWGVGTPEGAPVPTLNEAGVVIGHQRDAKNAIVISRLNESLLRSIAEASGSMYTRLTPKQDADIEHILSWVRAREAEAFATTSQRDYHEWHMVGSAAALLFLLIAWLL